MTNIISKNVKKLARELDIDRKRSIGEAAKELGVETHVIRFWESKFPQIKPEIGKGKRRYYYYKDLETLKKIKSFLYEQGYTIVGLQKLLKGRQSDKSQEKNIEIILSNAKQNQELQPELEFQEKVEKNIEQSIQNLENNYKSQASDQLDNFIDPNRNVVINEQNYLPEIEDKTIKISNDIRKKLARILALANE